jgi:hypothetical protein
MTEPQGWPDPYAAVLADLRAQRIKIDHAIEVIEGLRGGGARVVEAVGTAAGTSTAGAVSQSVAAAPPVEGEFLGMTIVDAVKKLLATRRRAMSNPQIYDDLKRGGLVLTSAEPVNVVGSVLTRRFNQVGDVGPCRVVSQSQL